MPLLVAQAPGPTADQSLVTALTRTPEALMLERILSCVACYLALETQPDTLRDITIVLYRDGVGDHHQIEQQLLAELAPVREQVEQWAVAAAPLNAHVAQMPPLLNMVNDDETLRQTVTAHIQKDRHALHALLGGIELADMDIILHGNERRASEPLAQEEYERLKRRLTAALDNLNEDIDQLAQIQHAEQRRLRARELQQARTGDTTPPEILLEIQDVTQSLAQHAREIQQLQEQQQSLQRDIEALDRRRTSPDIGWA
jgi:hypothetical protein